MNDEPELLELWCLRVQVDKEGTEFLNPYVLGPPCGPIEAFERLCRIKKIFPRDSFELRPAHGQ